MNVRFGFWASHCWIHYRKLSKYRWWFIQRLDSANLFSDLIHHTLRWCASGCIGGAIVHLVRLRSQALRFSHYMRLHALKISGFLGPLAGYVATWLRPDLKWPARPNLDQCHLFRRLQQSNRCGSRFPPWALRRKLGPEYMDHQSLIIMNRDEWRLWTVFWCRVHRLQESKAGKKRDRYSI